MKSSTIPLNNKNPTVSPNLTPIECLSVIRSLVNDKYTLEYKIDRKTRAKAE